MDTADRVLITLGFIAIWVVLIVIGNHLSKLERNKMNGTIEQEILEVLGNIQIQINYLTTQIENKLGPIDTEVPTKEDRANDTLLTLKQRMALIESKLRLENEDHGNLPH